MARILIIDDDGPLRSALAEALQLAGHEILQAEDGRQGVEVFKVAPCDLVVTDLIMPGQEGIETISQLLHEYPGLPIIAMSGSVAHSKLYLEMAQRLGARRTLAKPFSAAELLRAVDDALTPPAPPPA
jgi:DNA-binding NtrC family response regulator